MNTDSKDTSDLNNSLATLIDRITNNGFNDWVAKDTLKLQETLINKLPDIIDCEEDSFKNCKFTFKNNIVRISNIIHFSKDSSVLTNFFYGPENLDNIKREFKTFFENIAKEELEQDYETSLATTRTSLKKVKESHEKKIKDRYDQLISFTGLFFKKPNDTSMEIQNTAGSLQNSSSPLVEPKKKKYRLYKTKSSDGSIYLSAEGLVLLLNHIQQQLQHEQIQASSNQNDEQDSKQDDNLDINIDQAKSLVPQPPVNQASSKNIAALCDKWCQANPTAQLKFENNKITDSTGTLLKVVDNQRLKLKKECSATYEAIAGIVTYAKAEQITIRRGTEEQRQTLLNTLLASDAPDSLRIVLKNTPEESKTIVLGELRAEKNAETSSSYSP